MNHPARIRLRTDDNDKSWPETSGDIDDLQKNGAGAGQNEDDLPF